MRLLKKIRCADGAVHLRLCIDTSEDLWHVYNLLTPGDSITTKSRRKVNRENAVSNLGSVIKILSLEVEITDISFSPEELRISGINRTESEFIRLGAHHSLTVVYNPPQEVMIKKVEWNHILEERLKDACNTDGQSDTVAILMNYGEAQVTVIHSSFINIKAKIETTIAKKRRADGSARDQSIEKFFRQVKEAIARYVDVEKTKIIVLASPGSVRNEFLQYLKNTSQHDSERERALSQFIPKMLPVKVHNMSHDGIRQALSNPDVAAAFQSKKCQKDMQEWDRFQNLLNQSPDRCVYTPQIVLHAVLLGAVSSLMMSDAVFRSPDPIVRRFFLALAQCVKRVGGTSVSVFSSSHVTGEQLSMLGDVAAILSYDCPELDEIEPIEDFFSTEEVEKFIRDEATVHVTL
eukprot:gene9156-6436_t